MLKPTLKSRRFFPLFVALLLIAGCWGLYSSVRTPEPVGSATYSEVLQKIAQNQVKALFLQGEYATLTLASGGKVRTHVPTNEASLLVEARKANVSIESAEAEGPSGLSTFFMSWGPTILLVAVFIYMSRAKNDVPKSGGGGGIFAVGKSKARMLEPGESGVVFADVAGCDEAKQDVAELVEFLRDPKKFEAVGARIPRGVLLDGPPGTGKTLLARAIAGEAKVPFFSLSGSDFVEMLVGVGAARVRDLFKQAKANAPCIVFIDEIDAVGRQRGAGHGGGNDEREQTLNQMLVEMDGFEPGAGVIVLAATNRADILDSALTRPGRFDRQVTVGLPDVRGREQILTVHLRKVPVGPDVAVDVVAKGTPGFSGADLANLVNEAALLTANAGKRFVDMEDIERAKDKLLMGGERKSMHMSQEEKSNTAYHEAGHTLIARALKHTDPIHKVSIIPRGRALGVTVQLPTADRYSMGKLRILDTIAMLFGGRVAEELFTPDITTGASSDYERATKLARGMVLDWGMSDLVGPVVVTGNGTSEDTLRMVDEEVRGILQAQYNRVTKLLTQHADAMKALHDALMEHETLDSAQVEAILKASPSWPVPETKLSPSAA